MKSSHTEGITLVEVLVTMAILILLIALAMPILIQSRDAGRQVLCMAKLHRAAMGFHGYTTDYRGVFPAHRDGSTRGSWWGGDVLSYSTEDAFHCPSIEGVQTIVGKTWEWRFDKHKVGYGYNAYFLGVWAHGVGVDWTGKLRPWIATEHWFRFSRIKNPAQNMLLADSNPRTDSMHWSSTLWWPKSGPIWNEGVSARHLGDEASVLFNDGHATGMTPNQVNPPTDPRQTGDDSFTRLWDPLQRTNPAF